MRNTIWRAVKFFGSAATLVPIIHTSTLAQESLRMPEPVVADSARSARLNMLAIIADRNLNTFNWMGRAVIDTMAAGMIVKATEQYTSNIILLDGGTSSSHNLRSDQQNLSLLLGRPLASDLLSQVQWSSLVYSDNKSVGLGHAAFHSILGGVAYSPFDFVVLSPLFGYRWDNQAGVRDKGASYTLGARTDTIDLDGYQLLGKGHFHEDRLNPRLLQRHGARVGAQKLFAFNTRDSLEVEYSRNRSEFYAVADGNIESRAENVLSFTNLLDYGLFPDLLTSVFVKVTNRSLDRDIRHYSPIPGPLRFSTAIEEFRLETYYQAMFRAQDGGLVALLRLGHDERNELHTAKEIPNAPDSIMTRFNLQNNEEKTKNNFTRRTSLIGMMHLPLSSSDALHFSGATTILRYDTPSELDADARVDRDELLVALSLSSTHRVSRYLDLSITLDGTLSHVVYLFSRWSGNNNYNRVLRLAPSAIYRPGPAIISANIFEVLANYTVYDFEQVVSDVHSFSYRQFGWMDSSSVELTHRIGLDFFSYLKLYERGQLKWSEFSERTENSFVDKTISSQIRFTPSDGVLFAVGVRYFSQSRYSYASGVKAADVFIRSFGPTCLILWAIGPYNTLTFKGWYERRTFSGDQSQSAGISRSLPNLTMGVIISL